MLVVLVVLHCSLVDVIDMKYRGKLRDARVFEMLQSRSGEERRGTYINIARALGYSQCLGRNILHNLERKRA